MAWTLFYFIIALLLLVIFHELGHFLVARYFGVKVLRFSFGFGKVLFSWQDKRGTDYALSLLPLGGYVKMLDEEEGDVLPEERHLAFNNKPLFARAAIVLAGPVFNFLFAFIAFWLVLVIGMYSLAPIIDHVKPDSLAAKTGFAAHEEIIAINDQPVNSWHDFQYSMMPLLGSDDQALVTVKSLDSHEKKTLSLDLSQWVLDAKKMDALDSLGIVPFLPAIPTVVGGMLDDGPGKKAGIEVGDHIQRIDGKIYDDWLDVTDYVKQHPNQSMLLLILRQGKEKSIRITSGSRDNNGKTEGFLGLYSKKVDWPKQWFRLQRQNPFLALKTAAKQTFQLTLSSFQLIGRFISGKLSLHTISGPVGIAQGAGQSAQGGFVSYLSFLALISISLGVLNLLPIPMLDGGHLLFYAFEFICRRPLPEMTKLIGTYVGLAFLLAIMVLALSNDIARL